jgi:hypothetical protein
MRIYGRTQDVLTGKKTWWRVTTDANGFNDSVYLTDLAQVLKLNLGESPFFANYGIPAHESVVTQVFPNFFLARTQQQFAGYFASLILTPLPVDQGSADSFATGQGGAPAPRYYINVLTNYGSRIGVHVRPGYPTEQPI